MDCGRTQVDQMQDLLNEGDARYHRLINIIATIGPVSDSVEMLSKLMENGMNIARVNLSYGTIEQHAEAIKNIRQAAKIHTQKYSGFVHPIAIALDTKGAEIRTGKIDGGWSAEIELKKNDYIKLTTNRDFYEKGNPEVIYVDYQNIVNVVKTGNRIYVDEGLISFIVVEISGDALNCKIENGGILGSKKSVNLPGVAIDLPSVSEKDKADILFGVKNNVDFIFASTVRSASAIREIRDVLGPKGKHIRIVAKIENQQGLNNLDAILDAADGIMVARGNLGIESPLEKVFLAQKAICAKCNKAGKPVICSAQMVESMILKSRPTRAEISDIANAVIDGADCVMLSGETAKGLYPVECISMVAKTCSEAEAAVWHKNLFAELMVSSKTVDLVHSVAIAAVLAALKSAAAAIVVLTTTGHSAEVMAEYRAICPIIAVTRHPQTARQTLLYRGIFPILYEGSIKGDWLKAVDARVQHGIEYGKMLGIIKTGDPVVVVSGWKKGAGFTNTLRLVYAYSDVSLSEYSQSFVDPDLEVKCLL